MTQPTGSAIHEVFAYLRVRDTNAAIAFYAKAFAEQGLQIAAGVPLALDEGADFRTFRIGLFGLDKLMNVDRTVASFERALDGLM